jgi:peptide chain release factor 3
MAGAVKGRKAERHATSDWMALEQQRGISVTSSVMQFPYRDMIVNLLDTPGHADFSEDTYRTLTAVDSALMVIDAAKGVEERTIKLMEVCRLRTTPIISFINKLDRDGREPLELLDEIERVLAIRCTPVTWPIGMGREFRGVYHFLNDRIYVYRPGEKGTVGATEVIEGLDSAAAQALLGSDAEPSARRSSWCARPATISTVPLSPGHSDAGVLRLGDQQLRGARAARRFRRVGPAAGVAPTTSREVAAGEPALTGFVFKIQANMDPSHRDRIAFFRICSGKYTRGMKLRHVRLGSRRAHRRRADLHGGRPRARRGSVGRRYPRPAQPRHHQHRRHLHRGRGADLHRAFPTLRRSCSGVPCSAIRCAPRRCTRGWTSCARRRNPAVPADAQQRRDPRRGGPLQFDVVAWRLKEEYGVDCRFETINVATARWVYCDDRKAPRGIPRQGGRQPRDRSCRGAGLHRAVARESRVDARALAGDSLHADPRPPRGLSGQGRKARTSRRSAASEAGSGAGCSYRTRVYKRMISPARPANAGCSAAIRAAKSRGPSWGRRPGPCPPDAGRTHGTGAAPRAAAGRAAATPATGSGRA